MWYLLIPLVLLILLFYCVSPALRRHPDHAMCRQLLVAHRGLHSIGDGIPENSLPAIQNAIDHGYAIEIDIHVTKDGRVVVFHDDTLLRACGADKRVKDSTFAELRRYSLFGTEHKIPSLEEVLQAVDGKVPLVIEFKCGDKCFRRLCAAADALLQNYRGKYIVQSFNPLPMLWYRRRRPHICRGQLSTNYFRYPENSFLKAMTGLLLLNMISRPDFISYDMHYHKTLPLKICSKLGAIKAGWTFTDPHEMQLVQDCFDIFIFEGFLP